MKKRKNQFDRAAIEKAIRQIIIAIGEDVNREGLKETPRRVADMYADIFSGIGRNVQEVVRFSRPRIMMK